MQRIRFLVQPVRRLLQLSRKTLIAKRDLMNGRGNWDASEIESLSMSEFDLSEFINAHAQLVDLLRSSAVVRSKATLLLVTWCRAS